MDQFRGRKRRRTIQLLLGTSLHRTASELRLVNEFANVTNNSQGIFMEEEGAPEVANQHFFCPTRHGPSREGEQSHRLRTAPLHRAPSSFPCVLDIEHTFPKKGTWWVGWGGGSRNLRGNTRCRFPFLLKKMVPVEDINVNHHTNLNISHHLKSPIHAICDAEQPFASSTPYCCIPCSYQVIGSAKGDSCQKCHPPPDTPKDRVPTLTLQKKKKRKRPPRCCSKKRMAANATKHMAKTRGADLRKKLMFRCVYFSHCEKRIITQTCV